MIIISSISDHDLFIEWILEKDFDTTVLSDSNSTAKRREIVSRSTNYSIARRDFLAEGDVERGFESLDVEELEPSRRIYTRRVLERKGAII